MSVRKILTSATVIFNSDSGSSEAVLPNGDSIDTPILQIPSIAVVDGDLPAGGMDIRIDESGNTLVFRVKYSDGTTLKTGVIALS